MEEGPADTTEREPAVGAPLEPGADRAADAEPAPPSTPPAVGVPGESEPRVQPLPIPWLRVIPGCVLAWAFPGLGHVVLGRIWRGVGFGAVILGLFAGGIALEGKVYRPVPGEPLSYVATAGAAGIGVPYAVAQLSGFGGGRLTSAYHDYGNTFTLVAGLLNLLVVIDAYDVALGRR